MCVICRFGDTVASIQYSGYAISILCGCNQKNPSTKFSYQLRWFQEKACPELYSSFLSQITFSWFGTLTRLGNKKPLEKEDLWDLNDRDRSEVLIPQFLKYLIPSIESRSFYCWCRIWEGRKRGEMGAILSQSPSSLRVLVLDFLSNH